MLHQNKPMDELLELYDDNLLMPTSQLNDDPVPSEVASRLILDEMLDEGNARQNLATFCTTFMDKECEELMTKFLSINAIDKSEYTKMTELENRCVSIIADLWHGDSKTIGTSTVGSSEACMLGGLAMKFHWREQAKKLRLDLKKKPNLIISSAYQVCWEKFCTYFDVELRKVPIENGINNLNTNTVMDYVDDYTIGIVGILGITYTGQYDDIKTLDYLVETYNLTAKIKIGIHVDAASGGLFVPFVDNKFQWDFALKNVISINTSGHKYGLVYPGIGWILWRRQEYLSEDLIFYVDYLGAREPTMAFNFSRSGAQIIGQYYVFLRYGREGLTKIHSHTLHIARRVAAAIEQLDHFNVINAAEEMPIICFSLKNEYKWTLFDLSDKLRQNGWQVPSYTLPENLHEKIISRIVIRSDFTIPLAADLINDIRAAVAYLDSHIKTETGNTSGGFTH